MRLDYSVICRYKDFAASFLTMKLSVAEEEIWTELRGIFSSIPLNPNLTAVGKNKNIITHVYFTVYSLSAGIVV